MIPFSDYVTEGETIYVAVQAKYAARLGDFARHVANAPLQEFRLLFMVFSDRLEFLHLCDQSTIVYLPESAVVKRKFHEGNKLDPVIGIVLADHMAVRKTETPKLFVFSDGDVETHWYKGLLPLVVKFIWLHEPTETVLTPFGVRREVILTEVAMPIEPVAHLVHRDAMRHSTEHGDRTSAIDAVTARISAEVTRQAANRRAACELCRKLHLHGCTNGVMTDGCECINKPKIL